TCCPIRSGFASVQMDRHEKTLGALTRPRSPIHVLRFGGSRRGTAVQRSVICSPGFRCGVGMMIDSVSGEPGRSSERRFPFELFQSLVRFFLKLVDRPPSNGVGRLAPKDEPPPSPGTGPASKSGLPARCEADLLRSSLHPLA